MLLSRPTSASPEPEGERILGSPELGVVYTRPEIVSFALDLISYPRPTPGRLLDVGCGYGQFIAQSVGRLAQTLNLSGATMREAEEVIAKSVRGVEVNKETTAKAREWVTRAFAREFGAPPTSAFSQKVVVNADFLSWTPDFETFDYIVGNLPYVRYDSIPRLAHGPSVPGLRSRFLSFRGRADYSVAFVERALQILAPTGEMAVVTSNRFTQADYGAPLRRIVTESRRSVFEYDLCELDAFDESVGAYASLFHFSPVTQSPVYQYSLPRIAAHDNSPRLTAGVHIESEDRRGTLSSLPWSPLPSEVRRLMARIERESLQLKDLEVRAAKGPATGADRIFVRPANEWETLGIDAAYRIPVYATAHRLKGKRPELLSLYDSPDRTLHTLASLPRAVRTVLERERESLRARHVVRAAKRPWWGLIESFDPGDARRHKLIVPDLAGGTRCVIDAGRQLPLHPHIGIYAPPRILRGLRAVIASPIGDLHRYSRSPTMRAGALRASARAVASMPCVDERTLDQLGRGSIELGAAFGLRGHEMSLLVSAHGEIFAGHSRARSASKAAARGRGRNPNSEAALHS